MILLAVLFILSSVFAFLYLFGNNRFSPAYLLSALWLAALSLAQLRLSPLEKPFSSNFWLALGLFFALFGLAYYFSAAYFRQKLPPAKAAIKFYATSSVWLVCLMTLSAVLANSYIFWRFGTLPILSTVPDKMRFIINREVFGLWEYLALLPRLIIPVSFTLYLLAQKSWKKWQKYLLLANGLVGLLLLSMYASRLMIVITALMSYFSYLIIKSDSLKVKQLISSTVIAMSIVLLISAAIPGFRQFITYRDYDYQGEWTPFTYLADLTQIKLPSSLQFIIPIYIIPVFNLQALDRSLAYYPAVEPYLLGRFDLSVFNSLIKIFHLPQFAASINWQAIFLPWWVTATFLFGYFADFGWFGLAIAAIFWGILLSFVFVWPAKRLSFASAMMFSYFSFVTIMTIYMNYFQREELFMDLAVIFSITIFLELFGRRAKIAE